MGSDIHCPSNNQDGQSDGRMWSITYRSPKDLDGKSDGRMQSNMHWSPNDLMGGCRAICIK
eukprot:14550534-Ditylum_brightwellii.AAC.1